MSFRHSSVTGTTFLVFILVICAFGKAEYMCNNSIDCELLGDCIANVCQCRDGFLGPSCGTLELTPEKIYPSETTGAIWPPVGSLIKNVSFSWGFSTVYDPDTKQYHAVVNTGCCGISAQDRWPKFPPKTCGPSNG